MKLSKTIRFLNIRRTKGFILGLVFLVQPGFTQSPFSLPTPITDLTGVLDLFTDAIMDAADEFEQRTGVEAKVLAAYRFAPDSPFSIENLWSPVTADALLFVINTNEYPEAGNWNWEENVKIFASQNIITDFPASLRDQTISNIMIPILEELPDSENRVYEAPEKYAQAIIQALQYMADVLEGPYFMISDRKYYSGSVAYLGQADDEVEELAAFHADGTPFSGSSSWSGVTGGSGHIATFSVDAPSATSAGDPVSITYDNAGTTVELAIHIVVVKVTFRKHPDQVYGFDDNPAFEKPNNTTFCYPSYNTSPPKNGVPWKSIKVGKSDLVVAEVLPEGAGGKVFFESDSQEFSVLTGVVSTSEVSFSIQTGTQSAEGLITAAVGQENGPAAGWLRVVNFQEEMKTVILIEVYDGNLDPAVHALLPTQEEIEMEVKKLYRGGVINLDISFSLLENLKYDVANYNEIEVPDDGNYSPEMNSIFQKCNSCQTLNQQSTPIWFIFIVDLPTVQNGIPYDIQGRNKLGLNYGFVFLKNHSEKSISNTIAHELGHGIFSIKHPFIEFNPGNETTCNSNYSTIGLDQFNIMDYSDEVSLLFREYCWSKMHQP